MSRVTDFEFWEATVLAGEPPARIARISGKVDGVEVAAYVPLQLVDDRSRAEAYLAELFDKDSTIPLS